MVKTMELGPRLNTVAPDFKLYNHESVQNSLSELMGTDGLLLGFTGDIWQPASVRRILWFQRHVGNFNRYGVNIGLLICDKPYVLYGYHLSTATPLGFPLLADEDRSVHLRYNMTQHAGLVLINHEGYICDKWLVPDERVWPRTQEIIASFDLL
ncbi:MAG: peroxiredoxin family protein [Anaerolineae bacterium]|nr:peroxiredoxin family protein [Anaerolineae bacterium]